MKQTTNAQVRLISKVICPSFIFLPPASLINFAFVISSTLFVIICHTSAHSSPPDK